MLRNPKALRQSNVSAVMWEIYNNGALSRKELAKRCNLTTASMTQLIQQMSHDEMVKEIGSVQRNNTGRREVLLDIRYESFVAIGVNVEADNVHIAVCTLKEIIEDELYQTSELLDSGADALIEKIAHFSGKYVNAVGVCVGVSGHVDEKRGVLVNSYGLFENGYPLREKLEKVCTQTVTVLNNVKAQASSLINQRNTNFLYVKHAPGVGCAVVINGKIADGISQRAGEMGHVIIDENGKKCKCGKTGCLETCVSEEALLESYYSLSGKRTTAKSLYDDYGKDKTATKIIDEAVQKLALAIGNTCVLFDPQEVLLTGGLFFIEGARNALSQRFESLGFKQKLILIDDGFRIKTTSEAKYAISKKLFEV